MSRVHTLSRRQFSAGLAAAAAVGLPALAQAPLTKVRYQLDWRFEAGTIPHIVALRKGYFAAEGLDVSLTVGIGAAATVNRLTTGNFDMGTGDMSSLAEFAANNGQVPAKAVMVLYETTPAAVFSLKKSAIAKPADLKGKTLAAPITDGARRIFPLFASANGLGPNDVKWQTVDAALRESMLARGQVDAISGYIASGLMSLQRLGVKPEDIATMRFSDYGVPLYGNAVMATPTFLREQPNAVAGYLRALTRGYKDALMDRNGAVALLKAHEPLAVDAIELQRLRIILEDEIGTAAVRKNGIGQFDLDRYQHGIDALAKVLEFKSVPKAADLVDMKHLPAAPARMIFAA
ncbi:ABC transporter substrate-binding protein [Ramlibacter sp. G-1-2-2]|uniref:Thiamine pyrimidine synthase n=1 Tax=Ramlibacter agri TaxID=2728837 RepID=A0A848H0I7_9BURK|nr:ABC transporter substrate-binding protein [Ramlibacter agri]NML42283.1 ABC transporter substrate-binding protein [Ramlibacter agri]